jgi:hypothetical protein
VKKSSFFAVFVGSLVLSGSAWAHHGDAGRYIEEVMSITGVVVESQLVNPHSILLFDVTDARGQTVRWQAELGGGQELIRNGWINDMKPGAKVTLTGRRVKSGAPYISMTERARIILTDSGKEVYRTKNFGETKNKVSGGRDEGQP